MIRCNVTSLVKFNWVGEKKTRKPLKQSAGGFACLITGLVMHREVVLFLNLATTGNYDYIRKAKKDDQLFQVINGLRALPLLGNLVKDKCSLSRQGGAKIWCFAPLLLATFENLRESSVMFGSRQMKTFGTRTCDLLEGISLCQRYLFIISKASTGRMLFNKKTMINWLSLS